MQNHQNQRLKRYLTDPDQSFRQNINKFAQVNINQLKMKLTNINIPSETTYQPYINKYPTAPSKNIKLLHFHGKIKFKRNALRKLPEVSNCCQENNGNDTKKNHFHLTHLKKNPTYLVDSLFEMIKHDEKEQKAKIKVSIHPKIEGVNNLAYRVNNQFNDGVLQTKKYRAPRLVVNQMTKLTQQYNFRRKIFSEQKNRTKNDEFIDDESLKISTLTFYKPKNKASQIRKEDMQNEFI